MSRLILFQMGLCMRQVTGTGRISTTDGTFLEVSLEDITSRKRIAAENAHIWSVASMSEKVAL